MGIKDNSNDRDWLSSSTIKRVLTGSNGKVPTTSNAKVLTTTTGKVPTTSSGNVPTTNKAKVSSAMSNVQKNTSSAQVNRVVTTTTGKVTSTSSGNVPTTGKAKVLSTTTNVQKNTSSAQVNSIATTSSQLANNPIPDGNQVVDTGNQNGDGSVHIIDLTIESPKDELSDSESMLSENYDFLVVTSEVTPPQPVAFTPPAPQTQAEVRSLLNIFRFCLPKVHIFGIGRLLKPFVHTQTREIGGDGNCLF